MKKKKIDKKPLKVREQIQCREFIHGFFKRYVIVTSAMRNNWSFARGFYHLNKKPIDLGLSVKWASCNIGASNKKWAGSYCAWGEKGIKWDFSPSNYEHRISGEYTTTKYKDLGDSICGTEYDVAHEDWGDGWRLPTKDEFQELVDKCKWKWVSKGESNGYEVLGPNGNKIFLPCTGEKGPRGSSKLIYADREGCYMSGDHYKGQDYEDTLDSCAYCLIFGKEKHEVWYNSRWAGIAVRPVHE